MRCSRVAPLGPTPRRKLPLEQRPNPPYARDVITIRHAVPFGEDFGLSEGLFRRPRRSVEALASREEFDALVDAGAETRIARAR